jgi:hypothetical protein
MCISIKSVILCIFGYWARAQPDTNGLNVPRPGPARLILCVPCLGSTNGPRASPARPV